MKRQGDEHLHKIISSALGRREESMAFNPLLVTNLGSCPLPGYKRKGVGGGAREASKKNHFLCLGSNVKREKQEVSVLSFRK